jgi:aerobic-type carbon monoxide dehydrogenase small subunit (CoxS/CutS family)
MIIATTALFEKKPNPKKQDILEALQKHLCRCGSHARILTAINNMQSDHPQND